MAEQPTIGQSIDTRPTDAYRVLRTAPDELLRHDISDEELSMLSGSSVDRIWEAMWAVGGAALGSAPSAIASLIAVYVSKTEPMTILNQFQVVIFFASLAVAVALFFACHKKSKGPGELAKAIRERTRKQVSG